MDAASLACACEILALVVPEQKKGNLRLLLKYILRQFDSEDVEGSVDGGFSWYMKLHNYLNKFTYKKLMHLLVANKNPKSVEKVCLTITNFLRISFGETRQLCW